MTDPADWPKALLDYLVAHPSDIALVLVVGGYIWQTRRLNQLTDGMFGVIERMTAAQAAATEVMRGIRESVERSRGRGG